MFDIPPSPENRAVCEIKWENMVELDSPQMAVLYGAWAFHAGYLRLQTHPQNM
jgi:hypothetical protein